MGHNERHIVRISGAHRGHIVVNTERNMIPIFATSLQMFFLHKYIVAGAGVTHNFPIGIAEATCEALGTIKRQSVTVLL